MMAGGFAGPETDAGERASRRVLQGWRQPLAVHPHAHHPTRFVDEKRQFCGVSTGIARKHRVVDRHRVHRRRHHQKLGAREMEVVLAGDSGQGETQQRLHARQGHGRRFSNWRRDLRRQAALLLRRRARCGLGPGRLGRGWLGPRSDRGRSGRGCLEHPHFHTPYGRGRPRRRERLARHGQEQRMGSQHHGGKRAQAAQVLPAHRRALQDGGLAAHRPAPCIS
jgi:hypothetical protein